MAGSGRQDSGTPGASVSAGGPTGSPTKPDKGVLPSQGTPRRKMSAELYVQSKDDIAACLEGCCEGYMGLWV